MPNPIRNNKNEKDKEMNMATLASAGLAGKKLGEGAKKAFVEGANQVMRDAGKSSKEQSDYTPPQGMQMNNDALKMSPYHSGHESPSEMSPYKMESAKQEKYNLMHDNPVAKDASGGRDGSWMSKHVTKLGGSPIKKHCI